MTETLFTLITNYGVWIIFGSTFLSCMMLPIPSSLMMLAGGALVSVGDLVLIEVASAAYIGASIGDNIGFQIGRQASGTLDWLTRGKPKRQAIMDRARRTVDQNGGIGVFLSRWLFSPLGPWVNLVAGATGLAWPRFAIWDALGEAVWVAVYVGLGMAFATSFVEVSDIIGNAVGFLSAGAVALLMGRWLLKKLR